MIKLTKKQKKIVARAVELGLFIDEEDREGLNGAQNFCGQALRYLKLAPRSQWSVSKPKQAVLRCWLISLGHRLVREEVINAPVIDANDLIVPTWYHQIDNIAQEHAEWYLPTKVVIDGCKRFIVKELARRASLSDTGTIGFEGA